MAPAPGAEPSALPLGGKGKRGAECGPTPTERWLWAGQAAGAGSALSRIRHLPYLLSLAPWRALGPVCGCQSSWWTRPSSARSRRWRKGAPRGRWIPRPRLGSVTASCGKDAAPYHPAAQRRHPLARCWRHGAHRLRSAAGGRHGGGLRVRAPAAAGGEAGVRGADPRCAARALQLPQGREQRPWRPWATQRLTAVHPSRLARSRRARAHTTHHDGGPALPGDGAAGAGVRDQGIPAHVRQCSPSSPSSSLVPLTPRWSPPLTPPRE